MNVHENRTGLIFFATIALWVTVCCADVEAQSYQSSQSYSLGNETLQPYRQTSLKPLVRPKNVGPTLSMALPTSGPYQVGLQFGSQRRPMLPRTSFSSSDRPTFASTSPFPTLSEQIIRTDTSVAQSSEPYIGTGYRVTGQSLSRLAVRRAVQGTAGLGGVMGLTAAMFGP